MYPFRILSFTPEQRLVSSSPGLDERDTAFMERLRNLAREALTWPHLGERQRLIWAAALELDAVPMQELLDQLWWGHGGGRQNYEIPI